MWGREEAEGQWGAELSQGARLHGGRSGLARCSPSALPPALCTLMQMHRPEWFISSVWNGIMHPHPISLMKKGNGHLEQSCRLLACVLELAVLGPPLASAG